MIALIIFALLCVPACYIKGKQAQATQALIDLEARR